MPRFERLAANLWRFNGILASATPKEGLDSGQICAF
jgi:hypothetical protein